MSDRRDHSRYCACEDCLDERAEYSKPEYHDEYDPQQDDAEALTGWASRELGPE